MEYMINIKDLKNFSILEMDLFIYDNIIINNDKKEIKIKLRNKLNDLMKYTINRFLDKDLFIFKYNSIIINGLNDYFYLSEKILINFLKDFIKGLFNSLKIYFKLLTIKNNKEISIMLNKDIIDLLEMDLLFDDTLKNTFFNKVNILKIKYNINFININNINLINNDLIFISYFLDYTL